MPNKLNKSTGFSSPKAASPDKNTAQKSHNLGILTFLDEDLSEDSEEEKKRPATFTLMPKK